MEIPKPLMTDTCVTQWRVCVGAQDMKIPNILTKKSFDYQILSECVQLPTSQRNDTSL